MRSNQGCRNVNCDTFIAPTPCFCLCRRYYQPPASYERQIRGMTGNQGKPLWVVLTLLLTVVGSSLGVAFGWATGCHYGVYAAFGGEGGRNSKALSCHHKTALSTAWVCRGLNYHESCCEASALPIANSSNLLMLAR